MPEAEFQTNLGDGFADVVRRRVAESKGGPNSYGHVVFSSDAEIEPVYQDAPVCFDSVKIEDNVTVTIYSNCTRVLVAGDMTVGKAASFVFKGPKDGVTKLGDVVR